ncbi:hypothetical protein OG552_30540 [Streptomyces sp. NBC_01476]|uniref:hypothetical protein n=1 Tax=Streptomyces sp. NBC_01476 TaxID=2903881 RepID=UPI002E2EAF7E|nr:hypothetical protein [Streptomyces sp. NBC_01476]
MIDEDWRGFHSAFADAVRPDDPQGRAGRRMLVIGIAVFLATALGAFANGALGGGAAAQPSALAPITPSPTPTTGPLVPPSGQKWSTIAGPSCTNAADGTSSFAVYGYYTGTNGDGTTGWTTSSQGGYLGDGCSGGYISIPVSGQGTGYNDSRLALWKFDFSATFSHASCRLSTYVPENSARSSVGGDPAYFYYYGTDYSYGAKMDSLGGYLVNQVSKQGRWNEGTPFTVATGKVTVKMVDAGSKHGSKNADAHVAAAQIRLTCLST